jgi:hypothetical protein
MVDEGHPADARPAAPTPVVGLGALRRHPRRTAVVGLLTLALLAGGTVGLTRWRDARLTITEQQLGVALATFRPADLGGQPDVVPTADLTTDDQVRSDPAACVPLVRLAPDGAAGAESWSGVSGTPRQPVQLLTVRFADPGAARAELERKRTALRRCDRVALSFPPFAEPAASFGVSSDDQLWLPTDHLTYRLTSTNTYAFYLRRYGSTLTWSYANQTQTNDAPDGHVRQAVVDDLVARLEQIVRG